MPQLLNLENNESFQIERELVLSIDKGLTKVPLMHEPRGNPGSRLTNGIQLLPKQTGSIAPDHPPKQTQAWVRIRFYFTSSAEENSFVLLKSSNSSLPLK